MFSTIDKMIVGPMRFCGALDNYPVKRKHKGGDYLSFSFRKSLGDCFEVMTGIPLRDAVKIDQDGGRRSYLWTNLTPAQRILAEEWLKLTKPLVFLNSSLDFMMAMEMNALSEKHLALGTRTDIGELEHRAKERGDQHALEEIIKKAQYWLSKLPNYSGRYDCIAAVPRSTGKPKSLSEKIADGLSVKLQKPSLVEFMQWENKTRSLQDAKTLAEKREILNQSGLKISLPGDLTGKTVLLIDDLYQSGVTIEYVGEYLKRCGASKVIGLAVVKSLRNDVNVRQN